MGPVLYLSIASARPPPPTPHPTLSASPPPLAFYRCASRAGIVVHDPAYVERSFPFSAEAGLWVYDVDPRVADYCWMPRSQLIPVRDPAAIEPVRERYLNRAAAEAEKERLQEERRAQAEREQGDRARAEAERRRVRDARDRRRAERERKAAEARAAHRELVRRAAERHRDSHAAPSSLVAVEVAHQMRRHPALYDPAARAHDGVSLFSPAHPEGPVLWLAGAEDPRRHPDVRGLSDRAERARLIERYDRWREDQRELQRAAERQAEIARRRARYDDALARAEAVLAHPAPLLGPRGIRVEAADFELALSWCADWEDARQCQRTRFAMAGGDVRDFALRLKGQEAAYRRRKEEDPCVPYDRYLAQKLSARLAEKAARGFYESADPALARADGTRGEVEDISILQETDDPRFTREFDLRYPELPARARKHVDVKNTRRDRRDRLGYSHHRVNKARRLDDDSPVVITGVLSDYLTLRELLAEEGVPPAEILGETDRDRLRALEADFRLESLRIDLRGDEDRVEYMLPPWVFEAPDFAEAERRGAMDELRAAFVSLAEMEPAVLPAIPLCLAGGMEPVGAAWDGVPAFARALAREWMEDARARRLTLPRIYLSILRAFFRRLAARDGGAFDARTITGLLFHGPLPAGDAPDLRPPLGVPDPLACVRNLLVTLELLQSTGVERLHAFQSFEFRGAGELYGKRPGETGPPGWTLMFPHCGSRTCRHTRLQLGVERLCMECGRLRCDKCGFCTRGCAGNGHPPEQDAESAPASEPGHPGLARGAAWN